MPDESFVHRLDPRTKLAVQVAFVMAAFAHTEPFPLALLTGATVGILWLADMRVRSILLELRYLVGFLSMAPLLAGVQLPRPGFDPGAAMASGLAAYRVFLLVVVGLALVNTTTPREARGAISWLVPGRAGLILGTGIGLVFRFLPLLRGEARRTRDAMRIRLGDTRPLRERISLLGIVVFSRVLQRADRISMALRARCLAWNPTDPRLAFGRQDVPAFAVAGLLIVWALV